MDFKKFIEFLYTLMIKNLYNWFSLFIVKFKFSFSHKCLKSIGLAGSSHKKICLSPVLIFFITLFAFKIGKGHLRPVKLEVFKLISELFN